MGSRAFFTMTPCLGSMSLPAYPDKHDAPPFMTPADRLDQRFPDEAWPTVPDAVIVTLQDGLYESLTDTATPLKVRSDLYTAARLTDADVGVVGEFGIGAPALAIVVEELLALGATRFVIVGGCGTLQPAVTPGDVIVVDTALRDEGASHHYRPPAVEATADEALTTALTNTAEARGLTPHVGRSWTTDAFYRETIPEIDRYTEAGVLTVEMEAAALYAIADHHNAAAATILTPFDRLTDDTWDWAVTGTTPSERLADAFDVAVDTLATIDPAD